MELESQIANPTIFSETMYYDIYSPPHYPYKNNTENEDVNVLNNNVSKSDIGMDSLEVVNRNITHMVNFPLNVMPPPPHKMSQYNNNNNNSNTVKRYQPRDSTRPRDNYRPISPKGYDSDESSTSYSSRGSPTDNRNRIRYYNNSRCGTNRLSDQTMVFGKYSQSSPNVYHTSLQYSSDIQHGIHNNGHHHKNRYYTNSNNSSSPCNNGSTNVRQSKHNHNGNHVYHKQHGMDVMVKRAHGLVERFKSRSDLMRIEPNPPGLLNGGPWDGLNQAVWDVFSSKAQKEKTYESKISLWKNIFLYIRKCLNSYGLFMVGSTMSGFGLESSDIDMCLLTKPCTNDPRLDALHHLNSIRHLLLKYELTVDPELILAKVPILKFKDKETGFEIDLNCNNSVGIRNTHLLHCYARLDWRVRPLVVIVKLWAQANKINDAKNMTVSSYSWALMVIHFLQCGVTPPVLPCLHGLIPEKFNSDSVNHSMDVQEEIATVKDFRSDNLATLGELLVGFFRYYASYNFQQYAISVRAGCSLSIDECRYAKAPKNDPHQWKYLCIEEPFDLTNTARSVFDAEAFKHIKTLIGSAYAELDESKTLDNLLPVVGEDGEEGR
ncbi:unnamed protein product [Phaedon cochleariae]|uniref:Uncharacterized protein n=1 Tax=Phaedon cochleariae TaxID=80249 RepID=A0A9N9SHH8_PHACE|nr:unnamed protein product [Phaedon cochleariae]